MSPPGERAPQLQVCVVGAGPRGLSVLERLCANAPLLVPHLRLTVHMVDPYAPGAGQVWRTSQNRQLLMNTVASQVTMFTDDSVEIDGPGGPGPSLYEWARFLTLMGPLDGYPDELVAEARVLQPDSYPSRAFYGHYLRWVFRRVVGLAPAGVRVKVHRSEAVAMTDMAESAVGRQQVVLADGTRLDELDAVVLAQGHRPVAPTPAERLLRVFASARGLHHLLPANPGDVDLGLIQPAETVILRGLGLCFFDYLALLTQGRGGTFHRQDGRLYYRPSGREPLMYAGSRRGVPHHARGENEKGAHGRHLPRVLTPDVVALLRQRGERTGGINFRRDLWPYIAKETETVYYTTLLATERCGCEVSAFRERYLLLPYGDGGETRLLEEFGIAPQSRWDWSRVARPTGDRQFANPDLFHGWLLDYLARDVEAARAGNVSGPLKAALDVLRDLRNEIRLVVDHGGLSGRSHHEDLDGWYTPLNAFLSIGPPAHRVEEAIALIEAGVLKVLGPDMVVRADPTRGRFAAHSPAVGGSLIHATTLIEARIPEPDLHRTTDPLLRQLQATGQCRAHRLADSQNGWYETAGLAVTRRPYRLIDPADRAHPRRFAVGVPTESVHWVTAAGIRPGVNSVILGDSDAIARAIFDSAAAASPAVPAQRAPVDRPVDGDLRCA